MWIKERRRDLDLTQDDLAALLVAEGFEFTPGSISHWESGRYRPPLDDKRFRKALAAALKMSVPSMLAAAGYEVVARHSEEALRAADIVDQLPDDKKSMAIGILEQILKGA